MSRTVNVVRMQLVNKQTFGWVPLAILVGALAVTLAIWAMVPDGGALYSGGAQAPFWYFAVIGVQALTLTFPFSQAMSVTRREFYLGTLLTAALAAAVLTVVFLVGGYVEQATDGWGMNGYFFTFSWIWDAGAPVAAAFYFVLSMLSFVAGFTGATLYKRFGAFWLVVVSVGLVLVLIAAAWLVTRAGAWSDVMGWLLTSGVGGLTAVLAGITVVVALVAFPLLRRAVP